MENLEMDGLTLCDSISVTILPGDTILASVGNELRVFKAGSNVPSTLKWKLKNKIHGVDYHKGRILIYGEREFMVLNYDGLEFSFSCRGKISDWISSGKLFSETTTRICLVTGHSVAIVLRINNSNSTSIESRSSCSDKSTIYCSTIVGDKLRDCTIFAGTAFGELIIWKPDFSSQQTDVVFHQPVLHRIDGHNGVIFSIDVNLTYGLITTTSDDRSVRFYSLVQSTKEKDGSDWASTKITPLRSVYGHNARVFKAKIVVEDNIPFVISAGEDSYICIWRLNGDLVFKRRHHFGATIWDFTYNSKLKTLFSTSSDGNIISHVLAECFLPLQVSEIKCDLLSGEYLAKVRFMKHNLIVAITSKNKLIYRNCSEWRIVDGFAGYKSTLLEVWKNFIAITGYRILTLFKVDDCNAMTKLFERPVVNNVIRSFCFLSESEALVCGERGDCKYSNDFFETSTNIELPACKERWITSALKHNDFLVLANRQGNLFLYRNKNAAFQLVFTLKHIHGYLGVTYMNLKYDFPDHFLIRTAGHDSTMKTLKISKTSSHMSVVLTEVVPVAWIERFYKISHSDEYIIGFNDNHFVMWGPTCDVVFQVSCGGGHRCWDFLIDKNQNFVEFIFIKNRLLYKVTSKLDPSISNKYKMPYYSWHNKSCNIVDSVPLDGQDVLLVSGGEDNLLKFSKLTVNSVMNLRLIQNVCSHVSSIKNISITRNENKLLVLSAGGRAQICVTEYTLDTESVEQRTQFMLRSTDFDRKYQRNTQHVDFDPETRFMSIAAINQSQGYDLYLGCSDGYIRKFSYQNGSIVLQEALFYNRCVLHVKVVYVKSRPYLLSAATDGFLSLWTLENFSESGKPVLKIQHHDSGANSLDVFLNDDTLLIATGGDDQNINLSKIDVSDNNFTIVFTKCLTAFHTAQINGLKFSKCGQFLYSTSIDQTICKIDLSRMNVDKRMTMCIADVKGFNIFNINNCDYCIIYGWGIQICKL